MTRTRELGLVAGRQNPNFSPAGTGTNSIAGVGGRTGTNRIVGVGGRTGTGRIVGVGGRTGTGRIVGVEHPNRREPPRLKYATCKCKCGHCRSSPTCRYLINNKLSKGTGILLASPLIIALTGYIYILDQDQW